MLQLSGSLLNSSLGKCSQWPDSGLPLHKLPFYPLFPFDAEQRWGWGRRIGEQGWLPPYRIGCVFFSSWALGKCSNERNLRVSEGKGDVLYILPLKAQAMYENSSGRSHRPRGYWKQWNCDWVFLGYCILSCIMNVRLTFYPYIWRETAASLIFATYMTSETGACEFNSTGVMRVSRPSPQMQIVQLWWL